MKAVNKTVLEAIDKMLSMSTDFDNRYDKLQHTIETGLFEDLAYFSNRGDFIANTLRRKDFLNLVRMFKFTHAKSDLHKSQIDDFHEDLRGIISHLNVIKREIDDGLIFSIAELARTEIFADFLEMGKYYLDEGHKDAAAVIIGGVLENEIRQLCITHSIDIIKPNGKRLTIEPMSTNLYTANMYGLRAHKAVSMHAVTRNDAAHGDYGKYTEKEVKEMYDFVKDFKGQTE